MKLNRVSNEQAIFTAKYYAAKTMDVPVEKVYIVWFCKTLQNFKAMLSTDAVSGKYIEATYNGDKDELYIDYYEKLTNAAYASPIESAENGKRSK